MKSRHLRVLVLSLALISASAVAWASVDPQTLTIRDIVKQQTALRAQVAAGKGPFKDMEKRDREEMIAHQDRVLQMIGDRQTIDDMPADQRTELFNELQWIDATVAKAQDERMVCEYTRSVGSNRMQSVCMTAAQRQKLRDRAQSELQRPKNCISGPDGQCH